MLDPLWIHSECECCPLIGSQLSSQTLSKVPLGQADIALPLFETFSQSQHAHTHTHFINRHFEDKPSTLNKFVDNRTDTRSDLTPLCVRLKLGRTTRHTTVSKYVWEMTSLGSIGGRPRKSWRRRILCYLLYISQDCHLFSVFPPTDKTRRGNFGTLCWRCKHIIQSKTRRWTAYNHYSHFLCE